MTGNDDAAAEGDFLAVLAGLVAYPQTDATAAPEPATTSASLLADVPVVAGDSVDDRPEPDVGEVASELLAPAWPLAQALAALLAQPAPQVTDAADPVVAPGAGAPADADGAGDADTVASVGDGAAVAGDLPAPDLEPSSASAAAPDADAGASAPGPVRSQPAPSPTTNAEVVEALDADGDPAPSPRAGAEISASEGFPPAVRQATGSTAPSGTAASAVVLDAAPAGAEAMTGASGERPPAPVASASGVQRVLDVLERLELTPPPREVTLEFGDFRLRVAIEDGAVRLHVLGDQRDASRELVRAAADALRERGFDLAGDGRGGQSRSDDRDHPDGSPVSAGRAAPRTTDANTAGRRPGVHL
ncbi:hypothetical protein [Egicoccus halophilus]|nr:hypothetical protein [Egicoccus halophilus]